MYLNVEKGLSEKDVSDLGVVLKNVHEYGIIDSFYLKRFLTNTENWPEQLWKEYCLTLDAECPNISALLNGIKDLSNRLSDMLFMYQTYNYGKRNDIQKVWHEFHDLFIEAKRKENEKFIEQQNTLNDLYEEKKSLSLNRRRCWLRSVIAREITRKADISGRAIADIAMKERPDFYRNTISPSRIYEEWNNVKAQLKENVFGQISPDDMQDKDYEDALKKVDLKIYEVETAMGKIKNDNLMALLGRNFSGSKE